MGIVLNIATDLAAKGDELAKKVKNTTKSQEEKDNEEITKNIKEKENHEKQASTSLKAEKSKPISDKMKDASIGLGKLASKGVMAVAEKEVKVIENQVTNGLSAGRDR